MGHSILLGDGWGEAVNTQTPLWFHNTDPARIANLDDMSGRIAAAFREAVTGARYAELVLAAHPRHLETPFPDAWPTRVVTTHAAWQLWACPRPIAEAVRYENTTLVRISRLTAAPHTDPAAFIGTAAPVFSTMMSSGASVDDALDAAAAIAAPTPTHQAS